MAAKPTDIAIYEGPDGAVEVRLTGDTVWLNQYQLAALFGRERSVITRHVKNVFSDKELDEDSVCAKFAQTGPDGKTYQVDHYNLDAIISVGYRVKSKEGVRFRQWATRTLNQHQATPRRMTAGGVRSYILPRTRSTSIRRSSSSFRMAGVATRW